MKRIKILLIFLLCITGCQQSKTVIFFGSYSDAIRECFSSNGDNQYISAFTSPSMVSNEMYKMAQTHPLVIYNQTKYSFEKQIRKAHKILISIGFNDFKPSIEIKDNNRFFEVDEELFQKEKELLIYNVYHTLEELRLLNMKADIYLFGIYAFYLFEKPEQLLFTSLLNDISTSLKDICHEHKVNFISTESFQNESDVINEIKRLV